MRRLAFILVALLAACAADPAPATTTPTAPPSTAAPAAPATTVAPVTTVAAPDTTGAPADGPAARISISDFSFGPAVTVSVGDTVEVTNNDAVPHTWTSTDGVFNSGSLESGARFSFTFEESGEYAFVCSIHPTMTGTVTVEG